MMKLLASAQSYSVTYPTKKATFGACRTLTKAEGNHSQTERKALALISACKNFSTQGGHSRAFRKLTSEAGHAMISTSSSVKQLSSDKSTHC